MSKTGALAANKTPEVKPPGMNPLEIKAELILRGVSLSAIAEEAGVSISAVTQIIKQYPGSRYKGIRIRKHIAKALERNVTDIWPE